MNGPKNVEAIFCGQWLIDCFWRADFDLLSRFFSNNDMVCAVNLLRADRGAAILNRCFSFYPTKMLEETCGCYLLLLSPAYFLPWHFFFPPRQSFSYGPCFYGLSPTWYETFWHDCCCFEKQQFFAIYKNFEAAITTSPRHNKINFTICMTWSFVYGQNVPLSFGEWNQTW